MKIIKNNNNNQQLILNRSSTGNYVLYVKGIDVNNNENNKKKVFVEIMKILWKRLIIKANDREK